MTEKETPLSALIFAIASVGVFGAIIAAALIAFNAVVEGFVLMHLWAWLVLPVFPSLPSLSLLQAAGLFLTVSFVAPSVPSPVDEKARRNHILSTMFLKPALCLACGYAIHLFIS